MSTPRKTTPAPKAETKDTEKAEVNASETETAKDTGNAENPKTTEQAELKVSETGGEAKVYEKPQAQETAKAGASHSEEDKAEGGDIAQVAEKKVKMVKVKFIKAHAFHVGTDRIDAKPNDVKMVEMHTANKLAGRQIAYILG